MSNNPLHVVIIIFVLFFGGMIILSNWYQKTRYNDNQRLDVVCQPPECGFYYNAPPILTIRDSDVKLLFLGMVSFVFGIFMIYKGVKYAKNNA